MEGCRNEKSETGFEKNSKVGIIPTTSSRCLPIAGSSMGKRLQRRVGCVFWDEERTNNASARTSGRRFSAPFDMGDPVAPCQNAKAAMIAAKAASGIILRISYILEISSISVILFPVQPTSSRSFARRAAIAISVPESGLSGARPIWVISAVVARSQKRNGSFWRNLTFNSAAGSYRTWSSAAVGAH